MNNHAFWCGQNKDLNEIYKEVKRLEELHSVYENLL